MATSDVDLFFSDRVARIYLYGEIDDQMAKTVVQGIQLANQAKQAIALHIHSSGGDVSAGLTIMHAMLASHNTIVAVVDGMAFSMAAMLLVVAKQRVVGPHSMVLFHEASAALDAHRAEEMGVTVRQVEALERGLNDLVLRHSRIAPAALKRLMRRDKILDAKACLRLGVVDRIMGPRTATAKKGGDANTYYMFCPHPDETKGEELVTKARVDHTVAQMASFDAFVASAASLDDSKPVAIRFNPCKPSQHFDYLPWLIRVMACPLPVHAILDTVLGMADVLPALTCDWRIMYTTGSLLLNRMEATSHRDKPIGATVDDAVENHEAVTNIARTLFRAHTRFPVASLESSVQLITPREALRLKIVDEVRAY